LPWRPRASERNRRERLRSGGSQPLDITNLNTSPKITAAANAISQICMIAPVSVLLLRRIKSRCLSLSVILPLVCAARFLASAALCRYSADRDDMQGEHWKDASVPEISPNQAARAALVSWS